MIYSSRDMHTMEDIVNAPVGSRMKVLADATAISLRNVRLGEYHITLVASTADKNHRSNSSYIQIYYDVNASIDEKNKWLFDVYDNIKKEIDIYGSCKVELLVTKKDSDADIAERIGQSYQYACSVNYSQNSKIKIYMHDDVLSQLKRERAKNLTLDHFLEDIDIRRQ
ncbi:MAG: hypothetical protein ACP5MZ_01180 [Candidatus Micrarchaeia archaeon]